MGCIGQITVVARHEVVKIVLIGEVSSQESVPQC